ncbi:MAG: hypothetical protein IH598_08190 [Bacteroidales bacterium]|nr:hypothetical protein [Bacteroidales bacterium]
MNTASIRKKLYDYIRVADDRKVRAIYTIIENDMIEPYEWWNDKELLAKLDHRSKQIKSGNDKGQLWEDAKIEILNHHKGAGNGI